MLVQLARPVPKEGEGRIRIDKTYEDARSYVAGGDTLAYTRPLGIKKNVVVLPAGYELTGVNYPSQVRTENDGRIAVSFMNVGPAEVPYVVRGRKLTLQEMVRKATGFPAQILRLRDRGVVRPGAKADLVLFDPTRVRARSSYVDPLAMAEGFDLVMVNGERAFAEGRKISASGALLRLR